MSLSWQWIIQDAKLVRFTNEEELTPFPINLFGKWGMQLPDARKECLQNHILTHLNSTCLLHNLHDVFYLEAHLSSDRYTNGGKWESILTKAQMQTMLENNGVLSIAMALITEHKDFVELDLIESYVPHCGVARMLIAGISKRLDGKPVIPTDIRTNLAYWSKWKDWIEDECERGKMDVKLIRGFEELEKTASSKKQKTSD